MVLALLLLAFTGVVSAQNAEKPSTPSAQAEQKAPVIPDRYIVVLDGGAFQSVERTSPTVAERTSARVAGELARNKGLEVAHTYGSAIKGFAAKIPPGKLDDVRNDPRVAYVVQDREITASTQSFPAGIDRTDADLSSTRAGDGSGSARWVDVAVIDSGIYQHTDLNLKGGYNCMSMDRSAWQDDYGHGTHVAGTVAAKDNASGVVGTAPGARMWAVKVLDGNGDGSVSSIVCGINQVTRMNNDSITTNNIEVANMSLGGAFTRDGSADDGNCGKTNNDPMHRAICRSIAANITYVVAAGNDHMNTSNYRPASYDEVITVSALADYNGIPRGGAANSCNQDSAPDDDFAYLSNYGSDVDIGAPGVCILSTSRSGGTEILSGTSMASPHVAGAAALYKATHRAATPSAVRSFVVSSRNSEPLGRGHTDTSGRHSERVLQMDNY